MEGIGDIFVNIKSIFDAKGVKSLQTAIKTSIGLTTGFGIAIDRVFNEAGVRMNDFARQVNLIGGDFNKLNQYVNAADFTIDTNSDAVRNDLTNLFDKINEFKKTGKMDEGFVFSGISLNNKPEDILENIRDVFSKVGSQDQMFLARKMGIEALLPLLQKSREEFKKLALIDPLSQAKSKQIIEVANSFKQVRGSILALKDTALAEVAPALNKSLKEFLKWIQDNKESIINLFTNITKVMSQFVMATGHSISLLAGFFDKIKGSSVGVAGLTMAFGALTIAMFPVASAIAALVLILDDLYVYSKGGKSMFGEVVKAFNDSPLLKFAAALTGILVALKGMSVALKGIGSLTESLTNSKIFQGMEKRDIVFDSKPIKNFGDSATNASSNILSKSNLIPNIAKGFGVIGAGQLAYDAFQEKEASEVGYGNILNKALSGAMSGGAIGGLAGAGIGAIGGAGIGIYQKLKYGSQGENINMTPINNNTTNNFEINITGAKNDIEISRMVKSEISNIIKSQIKS